MRYLIILLTVFLFACSSDSEKNDDISYDNLPRWRGFNLVEKIDEKDSNSFSKEDFMLINELGFNFVRLPMSYLCWYTNGLFDEQALKEIDDAVSWGKYYNIHVSLNIHKAPGYWVNTPKQEPNLFEDPEMLSEFIEQWVMFARRYKGIPNKQLSFDLLNEPITTNEKYVEVVAATVAAIREIDPDRLIIVDGNDCGRSVVKELSKFEVAQSGRAYDPLYVTHFKCPWVGEEYGNATIPPTWPYTDKNGTIWDTDALEEMFLPWIELKSQGIGVHIGEMGVNRYTPHDVALEYIESVLSILKKHDIGFAFWNFRGTNGFFNSGREDVSYEDYKGLELDRKMLELIQKY